MCVGVIVLGCICVCLFCCCFWWLWECLLMIVVVVFVWLFSDGRFGWCGIVIVCGFGGSGAGWFV